MGVYFGATEITGLYFGDTEITGLYFGDTEIWAAWDKYDGTLPAQYTANGDYLADYRIYGASGGVGDRTENLCTPLIVGTYESTGFETTYAHMACTTRPILFDEGEITISVSQGQIYFKKIENGVWVQTIAAAQTSPATITIPSFGTYAIQINAAMTSQVLKEINDTIVAVKGSTAPTSYIPYGYEVDISVRSANLIDVAQTNRGTDYYAGGLHWEISGQSVTLSETLNESYLQSSLLDSEGNALQLTAGKTYYAKLFVENAPARSGIYIFLVKKVADAWSEAYTIDANGVVILASADVEEWAWLLIVQGIGITHSNTRIRVEVSESPIIEYVPYSKTVTPIYIGAEPLGEDEYVAYGEGKIYRMSSGTPTPTDPPVPLPALPTVDGTTITDYAGQSAAVPSRFVAKYRKEGF